MNGWSEYLMKQEQYRDQARDAGRQRLVKLAAEGCQGSAIGQTIRHLVSGAARGSQVPCGEPARLRDVHTRAA
jgi:hypothetical protein